MKHLRFENAPLKSLFQDKAVMDSLHSKFESLKSEMADVYGLGMAEGLESSVGLEEKVQTLENLMDGRESTAGGFGPEEAIVLTKGRPPLLIQGGDWETPDLPEIKDRLESARDKLLPAIQKVARVELLNSPSSDYVGTGWMIDEGVMITNRHVAQEFAIKSGQTIQFRTNPFGNPLVVQADYNAEHKSPNPPFEVPVKRVLFIADDLPGHPDMALLELEENDNLPEPIVLSPEKVDREADVAVIGYPASDAGRNDPFVMARLFRNIYDVKRLSPGRISGVREDRFILTHDCTTLGGSSGSVVLNLADGKAFGLHFAGSYKENNFAVTNETLRERLSDLNRRLVVTVPDPIAETEAVPSKEELQGRQGYQPDFLSDGLSDIEPIPLPSVSDGIQLAPVEGRDDSLLHYLHFTVAMHKERRMAMFTACNIDGQKLFGIRRGRDSWNLDPRMEDQFQIGNELYRHNPLDRGHLVRRLDPAWGDSREEAARAADDTFFYTNATPQHSRLNQRTWLSLEEYILDNAATHDLKVTVFTGPVLDENDQEYRTVQLPREYWKIVAIVNGFTQQLSATGYLLSQSEFIEDLEFVYGEFKTYQIPIRTIESKTGLRFGELHNHDPLDLIESAGPRMIQGSGDLRL